MSRRPGMRTRVYASNLGVVENNYKEALARLEKSRRPASADRETKTRVSPFSARPTFDFNGSEFDDELAAARSRASRVIQEKSVIDSRSEQLRSHSLAPAPISSALLENEFDDQVQATLNRIRASKNLLSQLQSEDALEQVRTETRSKLSEQTSKKLAEKMSTFYDVDDFADRSVRKTLKIRASADNATKSALKWKDETAESFAAKRASATKARLQDLDQEMLDFEEKQAARARRSAQLKKLLAETACDELIPATTTEQAGTKVTTGMVRFKAQKKVVSF
ncbi:uncharacterized protein LOC129726165 [Wyeomyia smithii]|uniref:uncharacterized protein LOC129726165 n=1 Tax=Wyeomyia smithii TaxID=174621 RepID=UPI002467FBA4|nr:uncharacterized protein LOC129726165 [Wyeomyia smithii]XP_055538837.1 uncharacterized protein LOC129726165 [Wyeomyia smithii]